jgi:inorganic pyrophosphatase
MSEKVSLFRPHPWHGIDIGEEAPATVNAYIEITPFDLMKYEVDKASGYLRIDRPQRTSSQPPALYGFIPRTYCGAGVAKLSKTAKKGDGDPLDICVLSERPVARNEIIVRAKVIGGLQLNDKGEADDKIVAVLQGDYVWGKAKDLHEVPEVHIERLQHYFMTYKMVPGSRNPLRIDRVYGRAHAMKVINAAVKDYSSNFTLT